MAWPMLATALFGAVGGAAGARSEAPEREARLIVYGDDPCPSSSDDEIVVCARRPEDERYRIPARLRRGEPLETSWASRVEALDDAARDMRPNSCSPVGSFGQSGCTQQLIRQWQADRRARARDAED